MSKVKSGLNSTQDLKLPIGRQGIAGYVAMTRQMVNIADVDRIKMPQNIRIVKFLQAVVQLLGCCSRQMLAAPVMIGDAL